MNGTNTPQMADGESDKQHEPTKGQAQWLDGNRMKEKHSAGRAARGRRVSWHDCAGAEPFARRATVLVSAGQEDPSQLDAVTVQRCLPQRSPPRRFSKWRVEPRCEMRAPSHCDPCSHGLKLEESGAGLKQAEPLHWILQAWRRGKRDADP